MFEGRIVAIFTAQSSGAPMTAHDAIEAVAGRGLAGDRYAEETGTYSGTPVAERAVTLIEREAVAGARAGYGIELAEHETRRNLVTEGVPLNHLVGKEFRVGDALLRGVRLSEPCAYLEGLTGPGVRRALVHRGGLRAEVVEGGEIRLGSVVRPDAGS